MPQLTIRINDELFRFIDQEKTINKRSLNAEIEVLLEYAMKHKTRKHKKIAPPTRESNGAKEDNSQHHS